MSFPQWGETLKQFSTFIAGKYVTKVTKLGSDARIHLHIANTVQSSSPLCVISIIGLQS
jgi:hypothetical protein